MKGSGGEGPHLRPMYGIATMQPYSQPQHSSAAASRHCCATSVPSRQRPPRDVIPPCSLPAEAQPSHTTQPIPYDPMLLDSMPPSHLPYLPYQGDRHGSHKTRPHRSRVLLTSHSWVKITQKKERQDRTGRGQRRLLEGWDAVVTSTLAVHRDPIVTSTSIDLDSPPREAACITVQCRTQKQDPSSPSTQALSLTCSSKLRCAAAARSVLVAVRACSWPRVLCCAGQFPSTSCIAPCTIQGPCLPACLPALPALPFVGQCK